MEGPRGGGGRRGQEWLREEGEGVAERLLARSREGGEGRRHCLPGSRIVAAGCQLFKEMKSVAASRSLTSGIAVVPSAVEAGSKYLHGAARQLLRGMEMPSMLRMKGDGGLLLCLIPHPGQDKFPSLLPPLKSQSLARAMLLLPLRPAKFISVSFPPCLLEMLTLSPHNVDPPLSWHSSLP